MSVNVTRSSVLEDGILQFPTRGPKSIPIPDRKDVTYGGNALRGLNLLQTRYDAPIASSSLASALEYQYDHLPSKVRELITWISPDDMDLFPDHLELGDTEGYKRWHEKHRADPTIDFETTYKSIRENEYLIQQVDTKDDHYVTVILHLRKEDPHDRRAPFTTVDRSVFIDPSTGPAAKARVASVRARLAEFMRPVLGNIDDRAAHEGELWVPPSQDMDEYFSSGLRAYILFEEICRRLIELYCHGKTYDPDFLWRPICAWTNLEKARDDMIGAASRQVRRYMDFVPRVTLALLKGPKNGKEDRRAPVQLRLYTPPEVGRIPKSRVVPDEDEDLEMTDSEDVDDASSVSVSGDENAGSSTPSHAARKSVPPSHAARKGLPPGGEDADEKEKEAEAEEVKPASIRAASPSIEDMMKDPPKGVETAPLTEDADMARLVEDAQVGFVDDEDSEKAECVDVTMQDAPDAVVADDAGNESDGYSMQRGCDFREDKDGRIFRGPGGERLALSEVDDWAGVQLSRRNSRNGAAQYSVLQIDTSATEQHHNDDETPVFYGPQWPGEVPRPASAAARYLANRLDLQAPEASLTVDDGAADALSGEAVSTVELDRFEIEVKSPAVLGEQEEHSLFVSPSDDVEVTLPDAPRAASPVVKNDRYAFLHYQPQESRSDLLISSSPTPAPADREEEYADEDEVDEDGTFCRSDAPSPEFDSAPIGSRPPTPAVEKSAKRKLSVVSDYDDDDNNNTKLKEPPAKRQHTELLSTPEAGVAAVVEYDPAFPALGDPTWTWDGVHSTGSQIPGLDLAQDQAVPTETMTGLETQATEVEGDNAQAEGTPSYIA
ncbi:hypothetical protein PG984_015706 [Apiospora sp. TS-2023a]